MNNRNRILSIFITSFLTICCNTTESTNDKIDGGERNYIWSIDTIYSGSSQTYMTSIWGSSKSNVWICGHEANNTTNIYYYDGHKWEAKSNIIPPTNFQKSYSVIAGIDSDYFVLAGSANFLNNNPPPNFLDSGLVIKFENGIWSTTYLNNSFGIYSLTIISKNDFWVGDRNSNLLHYYNNEWKKYSFSQKMFFNGLVAINSDVYATAHSEKQTASVDYLLLFQGVSWTIIDSNITSGQIIRNSFPSLIKNIGGQLYGSSDIEVVKKEGNAWVVIGENLYGQINGTNANNIFLGSQDFGVMHYNGKNWYKFNEVPHLNYFDIVVFDDSVFLLATDGIKSYIVKGFKQ